MQNKLIKQYLEIGFDDKRTLEYDLFRSSEFDLISLGTLTADNYIKYDTDIVFNFKDKLIDFVNSNIDDTYIRVDGDFLKGFYVDKDCNFMFSFEGSTSKLKFTHNFCYLRGKQDLLFKFLDVYFIKEEKEDKLSIHLLNLSPNSGYYLSKKELVPKSLLNIKDNYNDDFEEVDTRLFNTLTTKNKSFNILHGLPGTGKTTYIKDLMYRCNKADKKVVYLPPNVTSMLSQPSFIQNLSLFSDNVVVIEDAEEVLTKSEHRSAAISNILNITDGILAEIYNIHFIFTFNIDIRNIDPALLRKGRLTLKYEFKELDSKKASDLCVKLNLPCTGSNTLAEIYNAESNDLSTKVTTKIGFKN